jgi:4-amino-4-deoxy-L-arabinose transferase-like glycosyltransferase
VIEDRSSAVLRSGTLAALENDSQPSIGHGGGRISPLAASAAGLWLTVVTAFYLWTAVEVVRHPFNPGHDVRWALTTVAFLGASTLSFAFLPRRYVARVWLAGFAVICLVILILSRQLVSALLVAWLLAFGWSLGDRLLRWIGATPSTLRFEWSAVSLSLGLALLALLGFGLGVLHLLTPASVWACLSGLTILLGRQLWNGLRAVGRRAVGLRIPAAGPTIEQGFLASLIGFVALLDLVWAVAPEIHYDALNYHLAVPKLYLENGGFGDLSYFWHSYFAQLVETLMALPLGLDGQTAARLLTMTIGVIATLEVYLLGRIVSDGRVGLWAAALFHSTPLVSWLSTTVYVELATAMLLSAALLAFLRWREERQSGWLWASGLLIGAVIGAKPTAVLGVPVIVLVLFRDLFGRRFPNRSKWKLAAVFILAAVPLSIPWYAVRYVYTGNPVFPLMSRLFEDSRPAPADFTARALLGPGFGTGRSARSLLELPFRFTFDTGRFGEALPRGGVGLCLLLLLPFGICLLGKRRSSVSVLLAVGATYVLAWALVFQYARYFVPVLPVVSALGVATVDCFSRGTRWRRWNWALLSLGAAAQVVILPVQFWNIPERIPLRLAFGLEKREEFLLRSLGAYPAARYLNGVVEPGQKVLAVGADNVRFYLNAPLESPVETLELRPILSEQDPLRLYESLSRRGHSYLIDSTSPAGRLPYLFLSAPFLDRFATLVFDRAGVKVYRFRPAAGPLGARD